MKSTLRGGLWSNEDCVYIRLATPGVTDCTYADGLCISGSAQKQVFATIFMYRYADPLEFCVSCCESLCCGDFVHLSIAHFRSGHQNKLEPVCGNPALVLDLCDRSVLLNGAACTVYLIAVEFA